jgi:hypothetical protein
MVGPAFPKHKPAGPAPDGASPNGDGAGGDEAAGDEDAPEGIAPAHQLPHPHLLWVQEHLHHLSASAQMVSEPALHVAEIRQRPWWR